MIVQIRIQVLMIEVIERIGVPGIDVSIADMLADDHPSDEDLSLGTPV
jgi:hypothetical protein